MQDIAIGAQVGIGANRQAQASAQPVGLVPGVTIASVFYRSHHVAMAGKRFEGVGHILGRSDKITVGGHQQRKLALAGQRCAFAYRVAGNTAGRG